MFEIALALIPLFLLLGSLVRRKVRGAREHRAPT
jgi:hypothetical protein